MLKQFVLVDGNNIMNRAFYGIMGSKMLMTADGTYTNAVYGFFSILFKIIEDVKPDYLAVAFDLKAPTKRHKMYDGYKANRKGMPDELASQMPIIKKILEAMHITVVEKEGYEADDILGTLSRLGEENECDVTILSGDRDTFQLVTPHIKVRIPRTKMGKTETEDFTVEKIKEVYGIEPKKLIEVKGLMGDTSDNIPGVPGVGEKTALALVKKYQSIVQLYNRIDEGKDELKGATRKKIVENRDLAFLSKELGTIDLKVPLEMTMDQFAMQEWDKETVYQIFRELKFNRFIERFGLGETPSTVKKDKVEINHVVVADEMVEKIIKKIEQAKEMIYFLGKKEDQQAVGKIIRKKIDGLFIYDPTEELVYEIPITDMKQWKAIWESHTILKIRI